MGAYILEIHEGMLQTAVPIKYIDVEVAFAGDDGAMYMSAGSAQPVENCTGISFILEQSRPVAAVITSFMT